ncbi:hypothetical protein CBL_03197 [Carabus blaptoides fortunei]
MADVSKMKSILPDITQIFSNRRAHVKGRKHFLVKLSVIPNDAGLVECNGADGARHRCNLALMASTAQCKAENRTWHTPAWDSPATTNPNMGELPVVTVCARVRFLTSAWRSDRRTATSFHRLMDNALLGSIVLPWPRPWCGHSEEPPIDGRIKCTIRVSKGQDVVHVMKSDAATNGTRCFRVSESKVSCSALEKEHDM